MRVAVCDDEKQDLRTILDILREYGGYPGMEVSSFSNGEDLLGSAEEKPFDLVFLDIEMPGLNGYDTAVRLRALPQKPLILFLTNSMAYTLRGYGVVFRYLTKPIDQVQLYGALDSAIQEIKANRFVFQMDGMSNVVPMDAIYYLEVFNHHTVLHTVDQEFTFRATLKDVLTQLPAGYFGMPHQSFILNFAHIRTATSKEVHLTNGVYIPVSRRKQKEFERQFHQYLGR